MRPTPESPDFMVGKFAIHNIEEWQGEFARPQDLFAGFDAKDFATFSARIPLDYYHPQSDRIYAFLQSWVICANGLTILYDTGAGNDKPRPGIPVFGDLHTPFLGNLARAGFAPEDIDIVICSHLHIDHVGWNTRLENGAWVPTFPRARYLMSSIDRNYWDPAGSGDRPSLTGSQVNAQVFEDSVQPILDAGLAELVDGTYEIAPGITLWLAPGHTPGHLVLELQSQGENALFVGDILHHPAQVFRPDWNSVYCEDQGAARQTRRKILQQAADRQARVVPAHFGGGHSVWIEHCDDGFRPRFPHSEPDVSRIGPEGAGHE